MTQGHSPVDVFKLFESAKFPGDDSVNFAQKFETPDEEKLHAKFNATIYFQCLKICACTSPNETLPRKLIVEDSSLYIFPVCPIFSLYLISSSTFSSSSCFRRSLIIYRTMCAFVANYTTGPCPSHFIQLYFPKPL